MESSGDTVRHRVHRALSLAQVLVLFLIVQVFLAGAILLGIFWFGIYILRDNLSEVQVKQYTILAFVILIAIAWLLDLLILSTGVVSSRRADFASHMLYATLLGGIGLGLQALSGGALGGADRVFYYLGFLPIIFALVHVHKGTKILFQSFRGEPDDPGPGSTSPTPPAAPEG